MESRNILLVGIISHPKGAKLDSDAEKRDQARVNALGTEYETVFTISKDKVANADNEHHVTATMSRNGAHSLVKLLDTTQHQGKLLDYICLEYVRCPTTYYYKFLTGEGPVPGAPLRDFVSSLQRAGKLSSKCQLIFACCPGAGDRWRGTLATLAQAYGEPTFVATKLNPLFLAGNLQHEALVSEMERMYDHREELRRLCDTEEPFCVFKMGTQSIDALAEAASVVTPTPEPITDKQWRQMSSFKVRTSFTSDKQCNLSIRPKHSGLQLVIPGALNATKQRVALTFNTSQPFGISPAFGKFLRGNLKVVVDKWRTKADGRQWVLHQRQEWRKKVQEKWASKKGAHKGVQSARLSVKRKAESTKVSNVKRRLAVESPTVYLARKATYSIPIPAFDDADLSSGHLIDLKPAMRIYPRLFTCRRSPSGILSIPKELASVRSSSGKRHCMEYTLGTEFGTNPEWFKFVAQYLTYAASKWTSLKSARHWVKEQRSIFLDCLKKMFWRRYERYKLRPDVKEVESIFWRIAKSEAPPDEKYIAAFKCGLSWGFDPTAPPGMGLWCTRKGQHKIFFDGPLGVTMERVSPPIRKTQASYIAGILGSPDSYTPTLDSIKIGTVNMGFIVQHNRINPTHEPAFDNDLNRPVLVPLVETLPGQEFTFDYGWHLGEEIAEREDNDVSPSERDV